MGEQRVVEKCTICKGSGMRHGFYCLPCDGRGWIITSEVIPEGDVARIGGEWVRLAEPVHHKREWDGVRQWSTRPLYRAVPLSEDGSDQA